MNKFFLLFGFILLITVSCTVWYFFKQISGNCVVKLNPQSQYYHVKISDYPIYNKFTRKYLICSPLPYYNFDNHNFERGVSMISLNFLDCPKILIGWYRKYNTQSYKLDYAFRSYSDLNNSLNIDICLSNEVLLNKFWIKHFQICCW
jgi:hypothetical protein